MIAKFRLDPGGTGFASFFGSGRGLSIGALLGASRHGRALVFAASSSAASSGNSAASDTMMPLPIAVCSCSWSRSIASTKSRRSDVGFWTTDAEPAKATMPIRTSAGCSSTNAFAASRAAARRDGSTSLARIDSETSIARMMVRCSEGSVITALGRATATISTASARPSRSGGTWRRSRAPGPSAERTRSRLA